MGSVLVLGGTSWLGGAIAGEALRRGHDVTCLARGESGDAPPTATFVRADRSTPDAYQAVSAQRWDTVVDLTRQPGHARAAVSALGGTTGHWTLVSTASVYADQSGALTEQSALLPALTGDEASLEHYGEGKVACEVAVAGHPRHLIVRPGLIGGPGDWSDRLGHYVARFAVAGDEAVLVPDVDAQPMQVVDVRDLAMWVVTMVEDGTVGVVHGPGERTTVEEVLDLSAQVTGFTGSLVRAAPDWLLDQDVQPWSGPRSLPLWLPPSHHGMGMMDDTRAVALGLSRRPMVDTLVAVLADERERGLDRERRAGLSRRDELDLVARLR